METTMVSVSATGFAPKDPSAYLKITSVQTTPQLRAQLAEAERRSAEADKIQKDYEASWARKSSGSSGMQLGDVAKQSPQQAAGNLAAMTKLRDMYGENGLQVSAARGTEKTTSLSTYISWLQESAGSAQASETTPANLFNVKA
jgi:hypothetical protein